MCVWICPAEAVATYGETLWRETFWRKDVFSVSLSVTSRDVYDSCCEGNIGRYGTIRVCTCLTLKSECNQRYEGD